MQLRGVGLRGMCAAAALATVTTATTAPRSEVVSFDARTTYFREATPYGNMTVINPSAGLVAKPWEFLSLHGGYQADLVSGASIKTRNGVRGPDAVSGATKVVDTRHVASGGFGVTRKLTSLEANYAYSTENDYRSHSFDVTGKAELLQRSMELSVAYARNWDQVCDREQTDPDPTRRRSLDKSDGCFKPADTSTPGAIRLLSRPIAIDSILGAWTQSWTPVFATQANFSIQMMNGFLSNPYREVNIGSAVAVQEYVPDTRVRLSAGLRANYYLKPLKTALRIAGRLYRDTWDVRAVTGELELERYVLIDALKVRLRGRYYAQGHAVFYSDDYWTAPRGKYFTGDRELSTMRSALGGVRIAYGPAAGANRFLGMLEKIEISISGDYIWFFYDDFTVQNLPLRKQAIVASLGFTLLF
jgi:hypothetical protein